MLHLTNIEIRYILLITSYIQKSNEYNKDFLVWLLSYFSHFRLFLFPINVVLYKQGFN